MVRDALYAAGTWEVARLSWEETYGAGQPMQDLVTGRIYCRNAIVDAVPAAVDEYATEPTVIDAALDLRVRS